jgi:hypothetical protein
MVCFQTKNKNLGTFWRVLQWRMLVYFKDIWSILRPFDIFYSHLKYFIVIWYTYLVVLCYTFPRFGILHQEKSGNPGLRMRFLSRNEIERKHFFSSFSQIKSHLQFFRKLRIICDRFAKIMIVNDNDDDLKLSSSRCRIECF